MSFCGLLIIPFLVCFYEELQIPWPAILSFCSLFITPFVVCFYEELRIPWDRLLYFCYNNDLFKTHFFGFARHSHPFDHGVNWPPRQRFDPMVSAAVHDACITEQDWEERVWLIAPLCRKLKNSGVVILLIVDDVSHSFLPFSLLLHFQMCFFLFPSLSFALRFVMLHSSWFCWPSKVLYALLDFPCRFLMTTRLTLTVLTGASIWSWTLRLGGLLFNR